MLKTNPVYKKELKISVRTIKTAMIIFGYNFLLGAIGLFAYYASLESNNRNGGIINYQSMLSVYAVLSIIEFGLILFIVPAITSSAISGERERQTLEILLTTKLRPIEIILGKLASSISIILLLVISSLPILSIIFSIGGVNVIDLIELIFLIIVTAIFIGSIGIFYSTLFRKTTVSTIFTYGTIILLVLGSVGILVGIYLFIDLKVDARNYVNTSVYLKPNLGNLLLILLVNPGITLISMFTNQFESQVYLKNFLENFGQCSQNVIDHWFIYSITLQIILSIVLILLSARLLDPLKRKQHVKKRRN